MDGLLGPIWMGRLARLTLVGLVAGVAPLHADTPLRERVEARLLKARLVDQGEIHVEASGGSVILTGAVLTLDASRKAERVARKETDQVENRLNVLPEERSDAEIVKDVEKAILSYPRYSVFDAVGVEVASGAVRLQGSVYQPYRREDLDRLVGRVSGVRMIQNDIRVQPVSLFDDRLRRQLAHAIYGDERFVRYAHWPNPPVRIVVERGRVTLHGSVGSPVEQALLGHIARGVLSFGVENRVTVEGDGTREPSKASSRL